MSTAHLQHEMEDSEEKRELCLHCALPDCIGCLESKAGQEAASIKNAEALAAVEKMWWDGYTDKEIAAAIDRAEHRVYAMRRRLGLSPCNPPGFRARV